MEFGDSITLGAVLGEGASAVTYNATDGNGRTVCVKQYKTSVQSADKERIEREIDVLKKLHHPQVPTVFGAYIQEVNGRDLLHVVQEFVDGQDLQALLKSNTFDMAKIRQILADTLGILEYLHSAVPPILHRDIKPSNLMLRLDGRIVLIDFGQAVQDVHRTLGQTMVTGTIGYQAPEQISGNATVKSDVYSLGVVAVELLTGTSSFTMLEGQTLRWERHCRRLPLPVQEWLDGVLHPESRHRWDATEARERLGKLGSVFVEPPTGIAHTLSDARNVSTDFLDMLDGAIQDESEKQRLIREAEYRQKIEAERSAEHRRLQEEECRQTETQLWQEMLGSWEQLLSALQAKKVSQHKGLEIFRTAFETRVQQCFEIRRSGNVDPRVVMLIEYASRNPSNMRIQKYDKWIFETFLKDKEVQRKQVSLKKVHQQRELAMVKQELTMQSWWSALWKRSALEKLQSEFENEIASLDQQNEDLWEQIQQTIVRYILHNRNENIAQLKFSHERTLMLQSIESFHMVPIPAGAFMMGASKRDSYVEDDESPRHQVTLTKDFWMGKYPVTQELWETVMGSNPSYFNRSNLMFSSSVAGTISNSVKVFANRPVENVSWFDCIDFCNTLSVMEGREPVYTIQGEKVTCNWNANGYRLPTEAEWEYAARAGQTTKYSGSNNPDDVAWFFINSALETHAVSKKHPNKFGLYDMSGNVWEWVWDWYSSYDDNPSMDPVGSSSGLARSYRGGSSYNKNVLLSSRSQNTPTYKSRFLGFRLCRNQ